MARGAFSSSNLIRLGSAPLTAPPLTMACWFTRGTVGAYRILMTVALDTNNRFVLLLNIGNSVGAWTAAGGSISQADGATVVPDAGWHHAAAVIGSATSRIPYLDGVQDGSNATSRTPSTPTGAGIGCNNFDANDPHTGLMAEAGIWNAALGVDEIATLARGYSPRLVRPQNLIAYLPLVRDLVDIKGNAWAMTGTVPVGDHCRVLQTE